MERTLKMIASQANLPDVLDNLCKVVDAHSPAIISAVLLVDPDGKHLWFAAGPRLPGELRPVTSPWEIGPARCSCGAAAFLKQRVISPDVTTDPRWDHCRDLAVRHGLRASWSEPLMSSDGAVLGTFTIYYSEPRTPDASELGLVEMAAHVALIAIQMEQSRTATRATEHKLNQVSQRWIQAQEEERTRIAQELRNHINERLVLIAASLDDLQQKLPEKAADVRETILEVNQELLGTSDDVYRLSDRLHSWKLDLLGLEKAAANFCRELSDDQKRKIEFHCQGIPKDLPNEVSLCLYRVLQEALENAVRHSHSTRFEVWFGGDSKSINLIVKDWGIGFDSAIALQGPGLGLTRMRGRLKLVGGELSIESQPQHGTTISAHVPLRAGAQNSQGFL